EAGLRGFDSTAWYGLLGPAGLPREAVERLTGVLAKAGADKDLVARINATGCDTEILSPAQTVEKIKADYAKWARVVKEANIKAPPARRTTPTKTRTGLGRCRQFDAAGGCTFSRRGLRVGENKYPEDSLRRCARFLVGVLLSTAAFAAQAAITYSFGCITFDSSANCAAGSTQLQLTVADGGSGTVDFLFTNTGPQASSITDIYFDWKDSGLALAEGALTQSAGVSFGWGATPVNLPGGNSIAFSSDLGLDSNVPTQPSGINPGEWLNIAFAGSFDSLVQGI